MYDKPLRVSTVRGLRHGTNVLGQKRLHPMCRRIQGLGSVLITPVVRLPRLLNASRRRLLLPYQVSAPSTRICPHLVLSLRSPARSLSLSFARRKPTRRQTKPLIFGILYADSPVPNVHHHSRLRRNPVKIDHLPNSILTLDVSYAGTF